MTVQFSLRNATGGPTASPSISRAADAPTAPRWTRPAAMAALAVAVLVGIVALQDSSPTKETITSVSPGATSAREPLIIAEEQAFINRSHGPVVRNAPPAQTEANLQQLSFFQELERINRQYDGAAVVDDSDGFEFCQTHNPC